MTTRRAVRRADSGFTLVELLVVIAIIGMLAGLMLPAVQQAREAGRRAECINNQRNIALAVINYEGARTAFPGFCQKAGDVEAASWYFAIFPYVEQTNLYEKLQECKVVHDPDTDPSDIHSLDNARSEHNSNSYSSHAIAVFKCSSAGNRDGSGVNYVANCGPSNVVAAAGNWSSGLTTYVPLANNIHVKVTPKGVTADAYDTAFEQGGYSAVFFNKWGAAVGNNDTSSVNLEYITSKTGTSNTLLTSENVDAGDWYNVEEPLVGFCYPAMRGAAQPTWESFSGVTAGEADTYDPATSRGFPLWINSGKGSGNLDLHRRARPASNHPAIVVSAFCDGSVRPVSDGMDKDTFSNAMQPGGKGVFGANAFN